MKKYLITFLLTLMVLSLTVKQSEATGFYTDVHSSYRAYKEIMYLSQGDIVLGSNGYFYPDRVVTRAEAAVMLGRALGLNGTKTTSTFSDVGKSFFASGYIQSSVEKGIISGFPNGTFQPNQVVTRGQMALLISRAFQYGNAATTTAAGEQLMTRGIAQGISSGNFGGNQNVTRGDFAVFLARAIDYKLRSNKAVSFSGNLTVSASGLNVRSGPSIAYGILGKLVNGTKVTGAYRVGNWVYIKSSSVEGFVHGDYLSGTFTPGGVSSSTPTSPPPSNTSNPIASQVLVIDPGHGGSDPGASGFGLQEKTVTLDTSLRLKALLAKAPFKVVMTRETDTYPTLSQRVDMAIKAKGNAFISIHANAFNGSANGSETFYYSAENNPYVSDSLLLATAIQKRLVAEGGLKDRGVKKGNLHVLRENNMPASLVELGFIDNESDNNKLKTETWRQTAAQSIYWGILDYYKQKGFDVTGLY
jgi:N-acetylmuramoyl-L-alanine amidase